MDEKSQQSIPASGPTPTPVPTPTPAPTPTPLPVPTPASDATLVLAPTPVPAPAATKPVADKTLLITPEPVPKAVPAPTPSPAPAPVPASEPEPALPAVFASLKEHFNRAMDAYKGRMKTLLAVSFVGIVLSLISLAILIGAGFGVGMVFPKIKGLSIGLGILAGLLGAFWGGSWTAAAILCAIVNKEAGAKECFATSKSKVMGLLWVHLLVSVLTLGGYSLFIVPGILLTVWFFFAPFVCVSEGLGGMEALLKSREYVRGRWFKVAGRLLAGWFFLALIQLLPGLGQILGILLAPMPYIMSFIIYQDLKAVRGEFPFQPTFKAKLGVLAIGLGGFWAVPALLFFFMASTMHVMFNRIKQQIPGISMKAGISASDTGGVKATAGVTIPAGALDRVNIPEDPVSGSIGGKPFKLERAEINNGIVTLEQGKSFFADAGVTIFLFLKEGEIPFGRTFRFPDAAGKHGAHIHVKVKPEGADVPKLDMFMDRYEMLLQFEAEKAGKLPGKIRLQLADETQSTISGRFELEIKGLRMIDGHPDPMSDGDEVFKYVAQKHLEAAHPGKAVVVSESKSSSWQLASSAGGMVSGRATLTYQIAGGAPQTKKAEFVKEAAGWRVKELKDPVAGVKPAPASPPATMAVTGSTSAAPSAPTAAPIPAPAPVAAAKTPKLALDSPEVKEALEACANEVGMLCNSVKGSSAAALGCLKKYYDRVLPKCQGKLKALETAP